MSNPETVKVEIEIPKKLWEALTWYIRLTEYWISNDEEERVCKKYIVDSLRQILDCEAHNGAQDAARFIERELKERLGLGS